MGPKVLCIVWVSGHQQAPMEVAVIMQFQYVTTAQWTLMAFSFGFSGATMSSTKCLMHTVHVMTIFQGIIYCQLLIQILSGMPRPRWPNFSSFEHIVIDSDLIIIKEIKNKNLNIMRSPFLCNNFHYCESHTFFCCRRQLLICNIWFSPVLLLN